MYQHFFFSPQCNHTSLKRFQLSWLISQNFTCQFVNWNVSGSLNATFSEELSQNSKLFLLFFFFVFEFKKQPFSTLAFHTKYVLWALVFKLEKMKRSTAESGDWPVPLFSKNYLYNKQLSEVIDMNQLI